MEEKGEGKVGRGVMKKPRGDKKKVRKHEMVGGAETNVRETNVQVCRP